MIKITEGMWEDLILYDWCPLKKSLGHRYRCSIDLEGLCLNTENEMISKPR